MTGFQSGNGQITISYDGLPPVCGDGTLGLGETCDDGNTVGGDCCSATCQIESAGTVCRAATGVCDAVETCTGAAATCPLDAFEPSGASCGSTADTTCTNPDTCDGSGICQANYETTGTLCEDGNACSTGTVCTACVCGGGTTTACGACEACTGAGGCEVAPRQDCKQVADCGSRLKVFDNVFDRRDGLDWQWTEGERTTLTDFDAPGNAATGSDYAMCIFGGTSESPALLLSAEVARGTGWRALGAGGGRGFLWKGRGRGPAGPGRAAPSSRKDKGSGLKSKVIEVSTNDDHGKKLR